MFFSHCSTFFLPFFFGFCRLVGVGEASFISLAAPFIDDNAPAAQVFFFFSPFPFDYACHCMIRDVYCIISTPSNCLDAMILWHMNVNFKSHLMPQHNNSFTSSNSFGYLWLHWVILSIYHHKLCSSFSLDYDVLNV